MMSNLTNIPLNIFHSFLAQTVFNLFSYYKEFYLIYKPLSSQGYKRVVGCYPKPVGCKMDVQIIGGESV